MKLNLMNNYILKLGLYYILILNAITNSHFTHMLYLYGVTTHLANKSESSDVPKFFIACKSE